MRQGNGVRDGVGDGVRDGIRDGEKGVAVKCVAEKGRRYFLRRKKRAADHPVVKK